MNRRNGGDSSELAARAGWLAEQDPGLAALVATHGVPKQLFEPAVSLLDALTCAVVFQQLSGHAANAIHRRLCEGLTGAPDGVVTADSLLGHDVASLRGFGLSMAKARSLLDLAAHCRAATIPELDDLEALTDEAVIKALTPVRGIGVWTVQMLLISRLGRPDVMPATDLGIRKGIAIMDQLSDLPSAEAVLQRTQTWSPQRSLASWYLWRAAD